MTDKSLEERVKESFSDGKNTDYAETYLDKLVQTFADMAKRSQESVFRMLVTAILYSLIITTSIKEVDVGIIKITDISFAQKIIPVAFSFFFYNLYFSLLIRDRVGDLYMEIVKIKHPEIYENRLHRVLWWPDMWSPLSSPWSRNTSGFWGVIQIIFLLIMLAGPIAFQIYSYYQLINIFGWRDILVWISLFLSAILTLLGLSTISKD